MREGYSCVTDSSAGDWAGAGDGPGADTGQQQAPSGTGVWDPKTEWTQGQRWSIIGGAMVEQIWTGPRRPTGQSLQTDVGSPLSVRASHNGQ